MALDSLCRKPQFAIHDEKANIVVVSMPASPVAHFACHGIADENNLLQSGLIIEQEADENLSVADLESVTCEHSRIA